MDLDFFEPLPEVLHLQQHVVGDDLGDLNLGEQLRGLRQTHVRLYLLTYVLTYFLT